MTKSPLLPTDKRYDKILRSYKKHISKHGNIPLSHYCAEHNIYYYGIKRWLNEQNISIRTIRKSHSKMDISKISLPVTKTSPLIFPIHITNSDIAIPSPETVIPNTISKVKITYPTGVIIEIDNILFANLLSLTQ